MCQASMSRLGERQPKARQTTIRFIEKEKIINLGKKNTNVFYYYTLMEIRFRFWTFSAAMSALLIAVYVQPEAIDGVLAYVSQVVRYAGTGFLFYVAINDKNRAREYREIVLAIKKHLIDDKIESD